MTGHSIGAIDRQTVTELWTHQRVNVPQSSRHFLFLTTLCLQLVAWTIRLYYGTLSSCGLCR